MATKFISVPRSKNEANSVSFIVHESVRFTYVLYLGRIVKGTQSLWQLTKALGVRNLDTRNLDMSPPPQTPITTRKPEVPPSRVKGTILKTQVNI